MKKFKAIITGHLKHPVLETPVIEIAVSGFPGAILLDIAAAHTLAQEIAFAAGMVARGAAIQTGIGPKDEGEDNESKEENDSGDVKEKGPEDEDVGRLF